MKIFVSLFAYAFGKQHYPHVDEALALELERGARSTIPGFRTLHRLRELHEAMLHLESSTLIAKARSRTAGNFLALARYSPDVDLWVSIDDDVDAGKDAIAALIANAIEVDAITFAAMPRRDGIGFNFKTLDTHAYPAAAMAAGAAFPVRSCGAALACYPLRAIRAMHNHHRELAYDDLGGEHCGLFLETIEGRTWRGEDEKFCDRAIEARETLWAFLHPSVMHAGQPARGELRDTEGKAIPGAARSPDPSEPGTKR